MDMRIHLSLIKAVGASTGVAVLAVACGVILLPDRTSAPASTSQRMMPEHAAAVLGAADTERGTNAADIASSSGQITYQQTCAMCHGVQGQGMPHQGPSLRDSAFVARTNDTDLIAFVKTGRLPNDPHSVMKLFMPPRGGSPTLTDGDITQIIRHMRSIQSEAQPTAAAAAAVATPAAAAAAAEPGS
jgi:cytochrome c5